MQPPSLADLLVFMWSSSLRVHTLSLFLSILADSDWMLLCSSAAQRSMLKCHKVGITHPSLLLHFVGRLYRITYRQALRISTVSPLFAFPLLLRNFALKFCLTSLEQRILFLSTSSKTLCFKKSPQIAIAIAQLVVAAAEALPPSASTVSCSV